MPNGSDTTVATTAIRSDSSTAVHSSGVRLEHDVSRERVVRTWRRRIDHDVGLIRNVKPYVSKIVFAGCERMKARYFAASGLAFAVSATG